jgi:hypothetical protein
MADIDGLYPPAPSQVPLNLATPSASYRLRVLVVLTSILLFALLYLGLVVGSAYLCFWSFASLGPTEPYAASRSLFQDVSREDERLSNLFNGALQQRQQGTIDDAGFLHVLEREVLPPWRTLSQRLADASGLSAEERRLANQIP